MEAGKTVVDRGRRARADRPDRRDAPRRRTRQVDDEQLDDDRALGLPDLRLVLGHVHRQLDELPHRGDRPGAARQRLHARHPRRPPGALRAGGPTVDGARPRWYDDDDALGAAPLDRHARRLRERDGARRRDGRLDQHGAAHARRRPRGRDRLRPGRHRRRLPAGAVPGQGRAELPTTTWRTSTGPAASRRSSASCAGPGCCNEDVHTVHSPSLEAWLDAWDVRAAAPSAEAVELFHAAPGGVRTTEAFSTTNRWSSLDTDAAGGCIRDVDARLHAGRRPRRAARQHRPGRRRDQGRRRSTRSCGTSRARRGSSRARRRPSR